MKSFVHYFSKNYLPRWMVLVFDLTIPILSWFLAYLLRFNFDLSAMETSIHPLHLSIIVPVFLICFWKSKSYSGILRHSTIRDVLRIISGVMCAGIMLTIVSLVGRQFNVPPFVVMPISVIIIFVLLVITILSLSRVLAKILFQYWNKNNKGSKKIMIIGAGPLGQATYNALLMDSSMKCTIVGFIENNSSLHGKTVLGIPIYSVYKAFNQIINKDLVTEVVFAMDHSEITYKQKRKIADKCIKLKLKVKEAPPIKNWVNGKLHAVAIRPVKIEDLLGRNSIKLDRGKIEGGLKQSIVLITGAAGSIGSEIVRQLIEFKVKKVILLDKAESDLYNLQQEILSNKSNTDFKIIVGDVTNQTKLRKIFRDYSPTIVYSAAAYKHVPLMEEFPGEALRVNVGGLKNVADMSIEYGVEKFVFISTDKAVNPTNVMGASKRISEIYIQSLAQSGKYSTQFITTRFGNVLGSNGSVIPLFKNQIEKGGPVTVTHKKITRYFMTIPEACQLVLEAGFMGKGGEIYVFDMGEPVKIYDLAKKMISLSGFVPKQDIKIKVTGLRPGEKLYEELLSEKEIRLKHTLNDKIMIGIDKKHDLSNVTSRIEALIKGIDVMDRHQLVKLMMRIVPEFVSTNAYYNIREREDFNFNGRRKYIGQIAQGWRQADYQTDELNQNQVVEY